MTRSCRRRCAPSSVGFWGRSRRPAACPASILLPSLSRSRSAITPHAVLDENGIRTELLDALCDQIVTAVGVAHMFGLDIEGALAEVNRSNWSKFVDGKPTFDANGKIAKPATYSKPDLTPFL